MTFLEGASFAVVAVALAHAFAALYRGDLPERRGCLTPGEISAAQTDRVTGWTRRRWTAHAHRCGVCREHWLTMQMEFTAKGEYL